MSDPDPDPPPAPAQGGAKPNGFYSLLGSVAVSSFSASEKLQLIKAIDKANPTSEKAIFIIAICIIGFVSLVAVASAAYLVHAGKPNPDGLIAIASAGMGGLAGLLSPRSKSDPS